mmetsp:Transcript_94511/g.282187  ORF Transcript_94511/g.282187 Transcript_94511/m.282187 type:complete len:189 (-) Transcript_94511:90-656(-)
MAAPWKRGQRGPGQAALLAAVVLLLRQTAAVETEFVSEDQGVRLVRREAAPHVHVAVDAGGLLETAKSPAPAPTCILGGWSLWSDCNPTCGPGGRRNRRRVAVPKKGSKESCRHKDQTELGTCNLDPCPVDCKWGKWAKWTQCTKTCGTGKQSRDRKRHREKYGGRPCKGNWIEETTCNEISCRKAVR